MLAHAATASKSSYAGCKDLRFNPEHNPCDPGEPVGLGGGRGAEQQAAGRAQAARSTVEGRRGAAPAGWRAVR